MKYLVVNKFHQIQLKKVYRTGDLMAYCFKVFICLKFNFMLYFLCEVS